MLRLVLLFAIAAGGCFAVAMKAWNPLWRFRCPSDAEVEATFRSFHHELEDLHEMMEADQCPQLRTIRGTLIVDAPQVSPSRRAEYAKLAHRLGNVAVFGGQTPGGCELDVWLWSDELAAITAVSSSRNKGIGYVPGAFGGTIRETLDGLEKEHGGGSYRKQLSGRWHILFVDFE